MTRPKRILIIAGPNGAGKTTYAKRFLTPESGYRHFVNADEIALTLRDLPANLAAIRAGRIMLALLDRLAENNESFAFETTLAGLNYVKRIRRWRASGYVVTLLFLSLANADEAVERVRQRVLQGGHDIPETVIRRRFAAGIRNLRNIYCKLVDGWALSDNSTDEPLVLEWHEGSYDASH